tara:strand:+ start:2285 stop:3157 length:873 start_codon:yes stop_codon:yes gene_type:complete
MATLSGNSIKNTYQGLLKTSDSAAVSGTLKTVEDGSGNSTALSISSTTVKAAALQIDAPLTASSTNVLVWDSSTKSVGYRTLPSFETVTTTVTGATNPTVAIADSGGSSTSIVFSGGVGVDVTQASNTITFANTSQTTNLVNDTVSLTAADSGKVHLIDSNALAGDTVTLPTCADGLYFKFIFITASNTEFNIVTANAGTSGTVQRFIGKVSVESTTDEQRAVQIVANTGNSYDNDTLSLDADSATSGGNQGDVIEIYGATISSVATWVVDARLTTTNSNPSSIAVIGAA